MLTVNRKKHSKGLKIFLHSQVLLLKCQGDKQTNKQPIKQQQQQQMKMGDILIPI